MANEVEIQGLSFEVVGEVATSATKGLRTLRNTLKSLKNATAGGLGLKAVLNDLKEMNDVLGSDNFANVSALSSALNSIGWSSRRLSAVRGQLHAISELDFSNLTRASEAIGNILPAQNRGNGNATGGTEDAAESDVEHVESTLERSFSVGATLRELVSQIGVGVKGLGSLFAHAAQEAVGLSKVLTGALVNGAKRATVALAGLVRSGVEHALERMKNTVNSIRLSFGKFVSSFGRIAMYRAVRAVIASITQGLREGIGYLNLYSKAMGTTFHNALNTAATDALYLKSSFAAAVAAIIESLMPALDALADKIAYVMNLLARFFAMLGGKSTYTKAIKHATEYSDSISKAADKTKKFLLGIDELNIFDPTKGGGSGGVEDFSKMFEEASVGEALNLSALADKLNAMTDAVDWNGIGKRLGNGMNQAFTYLTDFIYGYKWDNLGKRLAQMVNGIVDRVNGKTLGKLLAAKFKIAVETLTGFISQLDMKALAKELSDIIIAAFDSMSDTIKSVDWKQLGEQVRSFLVNIDWKGIARSVFSAIGAAFGGATSFLWGLIHESWEKVVAWWHDTAFEDGEFVWKGLLNGILEKIKSIGAWVKENICYPFRDAFKEAFRMDSPSGVMENLGKNLIDGFLNGLKSAWETVKSWARNAIDALKGAFSNMQISTPTIQTTNGTAAIRSHGISARAEGGFVSTGELFLAREAGAELVGRIGSRTAVANNDQIVAGIAEANEGVIMALYSIANQIVTTVEQKNMSVSIGGREIKQAQQNYARAMGG